MNVNQIHHGDAANIMSKWPDACISLIISPPYFQGGSLHAYESYLTDLQLTWAQCARVLKQNGKMCINTALTPVKQKVWRQDTRVILNIPGDIDHRLRAETDLRFLDLYHWRKQTSKGMFGSYPLPCNILANNAVEMIYVYVKAGE